MSVNFSGCNAFMSQHFLNSPQVRPTFYEMGRERMTKRMWRYGFGDAGFTDKVFEQNENHLPVRPAPRRFRNRMSSLPFFIGICTRTWPRYIPINLRAVFPMGTNLSLSPFPITLINQVQDKEMTSAGSLTQTHAIHNYTWFPIWRDFAPLRVCSDQWPV